MKSFKLALLATVLFTLSFACKKEKDTKPSEPNVPPVETATVAGNWKATEINYQGTATYTISGQSQSTDLTGTKTDMNLQILFTENPNKYNVQGNYSITLSALILGQQVSFDLDNPGVTGSGTWSKSGDSLIVNQQDGARYIGLIKVLTDSSMQVVSDTTATTMQQGVPVKLSLTGTYNFVKE